MRCNCATKRKSTHGNKTHIERLSSFTGAQSAVDSFIFPPLVIQGQGEGSRKSNPLSLHDHNRKLKVAEQPLAERANELLLQSRKASTSSNDDVDFVGLDARGDQIFLVPRHAFHLPPRVAVKLSQLGSHRFQNCKHEMSTKPFRRHMGAITRKTGTGATRGGGGGGGGRSEQNEHDSARIFSSSSFACPSTTSGPIRGKRCTK
jgi:hypothetical protein